MLANQFPSNDLRLESQAELGQSENSERERLSYCPPQMVAIGKASKLMRNDSTGTLIDGTGGWWVWGS